VKYLFNIVSIYNVYYILHFKITFFIFFYSKPRENVHTLVCRYRHNNHPRLVLSPVKEEEVYRDATMVLFHDMLSDKEMKVIKALATPRVIYFLLFKVGCLLLCRFWKSLYKTTILRNVTLTDNHLIKNNNINFENYACRNICLKNIHTPKQRTWHMSTHTTGQDCIVAFSLRKINRFCNLNIIN
jgi:hypothetical protein